MVPRSIGSCVGQWGRAMRDDLNWSSKQEAAGADPRRGWTVKRGYSTSMRSPDISKQQTRSPRAAHNNEHVVWHVLRGTHTFKAKKERKQTAKAHNND